ncbi:MAG: hypothetical protein AB8B80_00515 [Marinicellaceae bacterium]
MSHKLFIYILLISSHFVSVIQAQNEIDYNYLEIGYGQLDLNRSVSANGIYLDGSIGISEQLYLGAHYENRADQGLDFDRYDLTFGFHTNGIGSTDFYFDARVGKFKYDNVDGNSSGLFAGSRSALGERFELITKLGLIHVEGIDHEDGDSINFYEASIKGLYKFTEKQALSLSLEGFDGDIGGRIGYRFSF